MEIRVSKDIRKYKTKDIGNFSLKEAGFICIGVAAGAITYSLTGSLETAFVPLLVFLAFAFLKPFGLTLVQFLRTAVLDFFSPRIYIWETDFEYDYEEFGELYGENIIYDTEDEELIQSPDTFVINKKDKDLFLM